MGKINYTISIICSLVLSVRRKLVHMAVGGQYRPGHSSELRRGEDSNEEEEEEEARRRSRRFTDDKHKQCHLI